LIRVDPIALADPAARDPAVVGTKAAGLARAAAAGLPVLPGRVLPVEASRDAIGAGAQALRDAGRAAAYLAAIGMTVNRRVARAMDALAPPGRRSRVVRSSTALDDDGRWSGAFSSYLDVEPPYVRAAVRGCWASAFSRDVVGRCSETRTEPGDLRIGVLVQPFLAFEAGGTARVRSDGTVVVAGGPGGPAHVVGGRSGLDVIVGADGLVEGLDDAGIGAATAGAAAALARGTAEVVGVGVIEWGAAGDEIVLLQVGPAAPVTAAAGPSGAPWTTTGAPAGAERLARLVAAVAGPLGEELILPWALGADDLPEPDPVEVADTGVALAEAWGLARGLAAAAWMAPPDVAMDRAAAASRLFRKGRVVEGLHAIRDLRVPDAAAARRVLGLIAGVGTALAEGGFLPSPVLVWRHSARELDALMAGGPAAVRRGPDRWEPFVAEVVQARGRVWTGRTVVGGVGAGRAHEVSSLRSIGRPGPRQVVVTPRPFPQLSPLLWHCAGLVTAGGSSGAHLFEVARSLGVPAVAGVDLTGVLDRASLVAVDGDAGRVSVLRLGASGDDTIRDPYAGARAVV
jgi:phosphohistidine swiveling domain-containing protein